MAFQQLPAYNVGNALNFSPLQNAVDNFGQVRRQNALLQYQQQRDQVSDQRQNALLRMQQNQETRAQTTFTQEQQDRAHKALAATFQAIGQEADPNRRTALYNQVRGRVKDFDQDIVSAGGDPNDMEGTMRLVTAKVQGYRDPLSLRKAEAEIANTEAQTGYYKSQSANKDYGARYKEVDNRLLRINEDGSVSEVYRPSVGAADPAVVRNLSAGLDRLAQVPKDVGKWSFESSTGSLQGSPGYVLAPLARAWGSVVNAFGARSTTEVRNRIEGDSLALAAAIKPLVRKPGEGTWTDNDQELLNSIVGNLAQANNVEEYYRGLEGVRQRVKANFGVDLPDVNIPGQQRPSGQAPQLAPGSIEDGYRFRGGNPADPNSWEPVR
jgi:hypothetical protein